MSSHRERIRRHSRRVLIGIVGGLIVLIGIVLIPYPGPGWLIVFAGLAILATEFEFASKVLDRLRVRYDQWTDWLKRQHIAVRILVLCLTGLVLITTAWLLNTFGLINTFLNLGLDWLYSPLFR
ncbi:MAG: TIGR02611 family protein [Candidatus Microsaccharimonas sp.]